MVTQRHAKIKETISKYGKCLEIVSIDPHFHEVSVSLFLKGRTFSVWSYSSKEGLKERLQVIRDRMVETGEMVKSNVYNQAIYKEGEIIEQPIKFMFVIAVEKTPTLPMPTGNLQAKDNKSGLTFVLSPQLENGTWVYSVSATGNAKNPQRRIMAMVGGYIRYGKCTRIAHDKFAFPDGKQHLGFARILINYAKNVSSSEMLLDSRNAQGQMTTQTLGFSQGSL